MKFYLKAWFIILLLIMSTALFFIVLFLSDITTQMELLMSGSSTGETEQQEQPVGFIGFLDGRPVLGNKETAKLSVVEFGDFECPYCEEAFTVLSRVLPEHKDDIYFQYRHFPLQAVHPFATGAALASMCAHEQGRFWDYHDTLFQNQNLLDEESLKNFAKTMGLDTALFDSCMTERRYQDDIEKDIADGVRLGVQATPTFFINGRKVEGVLPQDVWEKLIKEVQ